MKQLLLFIFTKILLGIRSKVLLSIAFSVTAAFLSAFLDALTVIAVIISVAVVSTRFITRSLRVKVFTLLMITPMMKVFQN